VDEMKINAIYAEMAEENGIEKNNTPHYCMDLADRIVDSNLSVLFSCLHFTFLCYNINNSGF
jgi:hypothetical protein